jgi:hypothetical protein
MPWPVHKSQILILTPTYKFNVIMNYCVARGLFLTSLGIKVFVDKKKIKLLLRRPAQKRKIKKPFFFSKATFFLFNQRIILRL